MVANKRINAILAKEYEAITLILHSIIIINITTWYYNLFEIFVETNSWITFQICLVDYAASKNKPLPLHGRITS